jgi:putative ABC transport system ATP-binding protein
MSLLEIRDLTVEYSSGGYNVRPIDGFSLTMEPGQLGILLGASGCGKSTLLSVIAGLLRPKSGSILVNGSEVSDLSGAALSHHRRSAVGIVFQAFNLIASLSARENIEIVCRTAGWTHARSRHRADELLEAVNLADRAGHRPAAMSGGQQQRVAIARALALDPPLVLADEPTAHLDYIQVESVLTILRNLTDSNRVVLVATHDERLLPLADTIVEMSPRAAPSATAERHRSLADGEVLFSQGDPGALVYLVEEGRVQIVRRRDDDTEEELTSIGPGGYFGELAPMFGLPRSATARALGPSIVTGLPLSEFRSTVQDDPGRRGSRAFSVSRGTLSDPVVQAY